MASTIPLTCEPGVSGVVELCRRSFMHFMWFLPAILLYCLCTLTLPSIKDFAIGFGMHFLLTLIPMSVILHRYFSHAAFTVPSRAVVFVMGFISCLAYQYGPLWWSGKHRRHHRFCDMPQDPHSWSRFGLWYAWIGWTMGPSESGIDADYVHPTFKLKDGSVRPELLMLDRFWWAPTWLVHAALFWLQVPLGVVLWRFTIPTMCCPLATLWFNCQFHPPVESKTAQMVCNSIDLIQDPLAALHGEAYHHDHHDHPRKAKRPGPDLGWYLCIKPLLALGVFQEMGKSG